MLKVCYQTLGHVWSFVTKSPLSMTFMLCLLLIFSWPSMLFDISLSYTYCNRIQTVGWWIASADGRSKKSPLPIKLDFGGPKRVSQVASKPPKVKQRKEKEQPVLGGSHFFCENRRFQFWGAGYENRPSLLFHSEDCLWFSKFRKTSG